MAEEKIPCGDGYPIVDPYSTKQYKELDNFIAKELLIPIFKKGVLVYDSPSVHDIREYCLKNISEVWEEILRFDNPHRYYVDLSVPLWDLKCKMLEEHIK